jgi:hypothetical protein
MKNRTKFIFFIILLTTSFFYKDGDAQITISNEDSNLTNLQKMIFAAGIDTTNCAQILDSLSAKSMELKKLIVEYCAESKLYSSIPALHETYNNAKYYREPDLKSLVLTTLVSLEDTTILGELKDGIDSLDAESFGASLALFASCLEQRFGVEYNWNKVIGVYKSDMSFGYPDLQILLLFYANHAAEIETKLLEIIRNANYSLYKCDAMLALTQTNYAQKEFEIYAASISDSSYYVRKEAVRLLRNMNSQYYIKSLHESLATETSVDIRNQIFSDLANTGSPREMKFIWDAYVSSSSSSEKEALSNILSYSVPFRYKQNSTVSLIDTLIVAVNYFRSINWLGSDSYQSLLSNYIQSAKLHYLQQDTLSLQRDFEMFLGKVDAEIEDTLGSTPDYISKGAWNFLYPNAYALLINILGTEYRQKLYACSPNSTFTQCADIPIILKGRGFNSTCDMWLSEKNLGTFYIPRTSITDSTINATIPQKFLDADRIYTLTVLNFIWDSTDSLIFKVISKHIILTPSITLTNSGGFILEVTGKGFTSASKVLWNDSVRTTTFVSDSLLRASFLASDVATVGDKVVRVKYDSTSSAVSDSMVFSVVNTLPKPVRLVIEKEIDNNNGTRTAWFGYLNVNDRSVYIPVGDKNSFSPTPTDRGQATIFLPGRHKYVFGVTFPNTINIEWQLNGRRAKAGSVCED